jgi:hypothetical protein
MSSFGELWKLLKTRHATRATPKEKGFVGKGERKSVERTIAYNDGTVFFFAREGVYKAGERSSASKESRRVLAPRREAGGSKGGVGRSKAACTRKGSCWLHTSRKRPGNCACATSQVRSSGLRPKSQALSS